MGSRDEPWTVVLTGATGFIGGAALRALTGGSGAGGSGAGDTDSGDTGSAGTGIAGPGGRRVEVRALARDPARARAEAARRGLTDGGPRGLPGAGAVRWVRADVTEPTSLRGVFDGADALVHAVSYLGGEPERCAAVNLRGTEAVMGAAERAGVRRIAHVSTAAVYGAGPHRGIAVDGVDPAPLSPASRTRLAGEKHALAAGALVLRPNLVTGVGDQWVVPAVAELSARVPPQWLGGEGAQSLVDVSDLARLLVAAATAAHPPRGVEHAAHPEPVTTARLRAALAALGLAAPAGANAAWERCRTLLASSEGRYGERQLELLSRDHHYLSARVWRLLGVDPGPGPLLRLAEAAPWYHARTRHEGP